MNILPFLTALFSFFLRARSLRMDTLIEYRPGDSNLILSVPHGGCVHVDEIPDRIKCCRQVTDPEEKCFNTTDGNRCSVVLYPDSGTVYIATALQKILVEQAGINPHMVINHLHRVKLDVNRNIDEAAQGDPKAIQIYNEYHSMLENVKGRLGNGLLLDLHGQSHDHNLTELGYLRLSDHLNANDYNATNSSVRHLSERTGLSGEELLIGPSSLGARLENAGYDSIPSPRNPNPGPRRRYYAGGHITRSHGSREKGSVDAIQIEMPLIVRKKTSPIRENYIRSLAESIIQFYEEFYKEQ